MMADENVTTGDENKRKTVCDDSDDDESEEKWVVLPDKCNYLIVAFHHIARINLSITRQQSHRWCNGQRARLGCCRSWVRTPIKSHLRL